MEENLNNEVDYDALREKYKTDLDQGNPIDYFGSELELSLENLMKESGQDIDVDLLEQVAYDVYLGTEGEVDWNKMIEPHELTDIYNSVEKRAYQEIQLSDFGTLLVGGGKSQAKSDVVNRLLEKDFNPIINIFYKEHEALKTKIQELKETFGKDAIGKIFELTKFTARGLYDRFTRDFSTIPPQDEADVIFKGFYERYGSIILDEEEMQKLLMYGFPYVYSEEGKSSILSLVNSYKEDLGVTDNNKNMFEDLRNNKK